MFWTLAKRQILVLKKTLFGQFQNILWTYRYRVSHSKELKVILLWWGYILIFANILDPMSKPSYILTRSELLLTLCYEIPCNTYQLHSGHFLESLPFGFFSQMIFFMLIFFSGSLKCRTTMTTFITVSSLLMLGKFTFLKSRKLANVTKKSFIWIMHALKNKKQLAFLDKN